MSGIAKNIIPLLVIAVSLAASAWASGPAIPAQFTGTWSPTGACETAYSDGVSIDASEVMFGETGFFVDRVVRVNDTEIELSAAQPSESGTHAALRLHLNLSENGHVLTIASADRSSTVYHRCP